MPNFKLNFSDDFIEDGEGIQIITDLQEMDDIITEDFLKDLPQELQQIVKEIKEKSKGNVCPKLKSDASGAFGSIEISKNIVKKVLGLIQPKHHKTLINAYKHKKKKSQLYFLINRLNNYCEDIKLFVKNTQKFFPNNFLNIYKCNLCKGQQKRSLTPNVYVEMALGKGSTLSDVLKQKTISKKELESVFVQIYYISMTLNMKKLFHNDLKPANIIIAKSNKPIIYDALKSNREVINMKLPKGSYYPILIDYDLCSKNEAETVQAPQGAFINPVTPDYSFFIATTEKIDNKQGKILNSLPEFDSNLEIKRGIVEMYNAMKKYNKVLTITHNQTGGKNKKRKSK
jgi:serine/threonine protein kinase